MLFYHFANLFSNLPPFDLAVFTSQVDFRIDVFRTLGEAFIQHPFQRDTTTFRTAELNTSEVRILIPALVRHIDSFLNTLL